MIDKILNCIFPPCCGICGKIDKKWICSTCYRNIRPTIQLRKIRINKKLHVYYIFLYEGIIREKILSYKFKENSYLHKMFSEMIIRNKSICEFIEKYDYVLPVPLHIQNKKKRGYNQTELIAKEISKTVDIFFEKENLIKKVNTKRQSSLNEKERKENVKNVYELKNPDKLKNKKILIFDDICTTGATIYECYKVLKKCTNDISFLVLAKSNYKKGVRKSGRIS